MKIAIIYVHPAMSLSVYRPAARRFVDTYMEFPPGEADHRIYVIVNGERVRPDHRKLFEPLPCEFIQGSNVGKDCGAHIWAAENIPCDLMVCFGAHVHFHRAGWMDRIVNVFLEQGPALYGPWGVPFLGGDHIRTTAYWAPPELISSFPHAVGTDEHRYSYERGPNSLTQHVLKSGFPCIMVTWDGYYGHDAWHVINGRDSLILDQWSSGERG